jgi:hypothetical protein
MDLVSPTQKSQVGKNLDVPNYGTKFPVLKRQTFPELIVAKEIVIN